MEPRPIRSQPDDAYVYHPERDEPPSEAVIRAVGTASGVDPTADVDRLPALYDAVDPDALDALFESSASTGAAVVRFCYSGYDVTVDGSGAVKLVEA